MNKEFTPKQWVLVRDWNSQEWRLNIFSHYSEEWKYVCVASVWKQCIPYEGNESLRGTTDEPVKPYEPQDGDFIVQHNAENKEIVNWKWKPKEGEIIYYIYFSNEEGIFKVDKGEWIEGLFLGFTRKYIFQTREEGQLFCDKLNKAIKNVNL